MKRRSFISKTGSLAIFTALGTGSITVLSCGTEVSNEYVLLNEFMPTKDFLEIISTLDSQNTPEGKSNELNRTKLIERIKSDFKNGDVFLCNGWILSEHEVNDLINSISNIQ